jgi:hypothetical protein
MSAHTVGPWRVVDYGQNPVQIHAGNQNGAAIALVYVNVHRARERSPEHEANARLIAAAPELVEAVREYRRQYGNCGAPIQQQAANAVDAILARIGGAA